MAPSRPPWPYILAAALALAASIASAQVRPFITDASLCDESQIVVLATKKGAVSTSPESFAYRPSASTEDVTRRNVSEVNFEVDKVLKGNLTPGNYVLVLAPPNRGFYPAMFDMPGSIPGDDPDGEGRLDVQACYFLQPARKVGDTSDKLYLLEENESDEKSAALTPLYETLLKPNRNELMTDLLVSGNEALEYRALLYVNGNGFYPVTNPPNPYDFDPMHLARPALPGYKSEVEDLLRSPYADVRRLAVQVLNHIEGPRCELTTRRLIHDSDYLTAEEAFELAVQTHDASSLAALPEAATRIVELDSESRNFASTPPGLYRLASGPYGMVYDLQKWRDGRLIPTLIRFLESSDPSAPKAVAAVADDELESLVGARFPFDVYKARRLWAQVSSLPYALRRQTLLRAFGTPRPIVLEAVHFHDHIFATVINKGRSPLMISATPDRWSFVIDGTNQIEAQAHQETSEPFLLMPGEQREVDVPAPSLDRYGMTVTLSYLVLHREDRHEGWVGDLKAHVSSGSSESVTK